jgi:hypothetical protein
MRIGRNVTMQDQSQDEHGEVYIGSGSLKE